MNSKHLQQFLVLLVIFLVCSMTPATANQNSIKSNNDNVVVLFNETYIKDMSNLLIGFDEASNTELTPEQDKYLETHEPLLLSKAETILYNLQQFLNILLTEYNTQNTTTKRSKNYTDPEMMKFNTTAKEMVSYLNNDTPFKGVTYGCCTCSELDKCVANKTYNNGYVVIQVKDPISSKGYIRYVELVNIYSNSEGDKIRLKVGSEFEELTWEQFNNTYGYGNNTTNKGKFNIISTNNYPAHSVLKSICNKQKEDLMDEKVGLEKGNWACNILATLLGIVVMSAGVYRLSDDYKNRVRNRIEEIAVDPSEVTPLLQHNGLVNRYTRLKSTISTIFGSRYTNSVCIILAGVSIAIGGIIGFCICTDKINTCNKNLDNLKQYIP